MAEAALARRLMSKTGSFPLWRESPGLDFATLAIVLGWAFVAMGIMHIIGAIVSRRTIHPAPASTPVTSPSLLALAYLGFTTVIVVWAKMVS
jgi:uncharacterized membrane protein HdeD (DUF308 family)